MSVCRASCVLSLFFCDIKVCLYRAPKMLPQRTPLLKTRPQILWPMFHKRWSLIFLPWNMSWPQGLTCHRRIEVMLCHFQLPLGCFLFFLLGCCSWNSAPQCRGEAQATRRGPPGGDEGPRTQPAPTPTQLFESSNQGPNISSKDGPSLLYPVLGPASQDLWAK